MNENATPLPAKIVSPEEQARAEANRQAQIRMIQTTIQVINDGIEFVSKQTIAVSESRRIANFVDYLQDLKKDFKTTQKQLEGNEPKEPAKKPELVEA